MAVSGERRGQEEEKSGAGRGTGRRKEEGGESAGAANLACLPIIRRSPVLFRQR